eukprot:71564_1
MESFRQDLSKKDLQALARILRNIIDHPNEARYGNIIAHRLIGKLQDDVECIDVLKEAGFEYSEDGSRLIYNTKRDDQCRYVYACLLSMSMSDVAEQSQTEESKINRSTASPVTKSQAKQAIIPTIDTACTDNTKYVITEPQESKTDPNTATIQQSHDNAMNDNKCDILKSMGFDKQKAMKALEMTGFDVESALNQLLLDDTSAKSCDIGGASTMSEQKQIDNRNDDDKSIHLLNGSRNKKFCSNFHQSRVHNQEVFQHIHIHFHFVINQNAKIPGSSIFIGLLGICMFP